MKGIRSLKHLVAAGKLHTPKRSFQFFVPYMQSEQWIKKFEVGNAFGISQILLPKSLLSMQQCENKQMQKTLLSIGFTEEEIGNSVKEDSAFLKYPAQKLQNVFSVLLQQGLSENDVKKIFLSIPQIIEVNTNDINKTINKWREFKLDEEKMLRLFVNYPLFLTLTPEYIDSRWKNVLDLFTNSDITVLLEKMPSIFVQDWNTILQKVHYIQSYMGFTQIQMMRTSCLEHSLKHIKTRHRFILLAGVFKPRNPKKQILNNPSLKSIVDSTDHDFVKSCGLTLEEYNTFRTILAENEDIAE